MPKFLSDGIVFTNATLAQLANARCGVNQKCLFDVSSTGQLEIGDLNIKFEETIEATNEMFVEAAKHCIPMSLNFENGKYEQKVVNDYLIEYKFLCNDGFCLEGKSEISCQNGVNSDTVPKCINCTKTTITTTPTTTTTTTPSITNGNSSSKNYFSLTITKLYIFLILEFSLFMFRN